MRRVVEPHTRASLDLGGGLFDAVFRTTCLWPGREARMLRGRPATVFARDYD
jgi:hypothetical protein